MAGGRGGRGEGQVFETGELGSLHAHGPPTDGPKNGNRCDEGNEREKRTGIFKDEATEHKRNKMR